LYTLYVSQSKKYRDDLILSFYKIFHYVHRILQRSTDGSLEFAWLEFTYVDDIIMLLNSIRFNI